MGRSFPWACASNGNDASIREAINAMQETCKHRVQRGELKRRIVTSSVPDPLLRRHFEKDFQLDRGAERKACDAIHQAARTLVLSEHVLQQLRSASATLG